jgi:teichoic acid transport system ATP-binding protein
MAATDRPEFDEIDFEADDADVPGAPEPPEHDDATIGTPSLIVDDLHIRYRIIGSGKRQTVTDGPPPSRARRLLNRGSQHVGTTEVHAVRGVSFVAHHGESIGIVGRNGAGKSTLLRAIAGLIPPSQGTVYVRGTSSLLGVNAALMGQLSGERNIMLGGLALGLTPDQVRKRFDEIVEFAGIGDFVYMPMKAYSSGMAARLRFAISTAAIPDVLMIDEALATGDAEFRARSSAKIREVKDHAGTVFLVSHSNKAITQMCDRAVWIEKGELVMDGPSDEVVAAYAKSLKR